MIGWWALKSEFKAGLVGMLLLVLAGGWLVAMIIIHDGFRKRNWLLRPTFSGWWWCSWLENQSFVEWKFTTRIELGLALGASVDSRHRFSCYFTFWMNPEGFSLFAFLYLLFGDNIRCASMFWMWESHKMSKIRFLININSSLFDRVHYKSCRGIFVVVVNPLHWHN